MDLALFVVQVPSDFPDMPHLARLLDGIPRERRVVVDLWGRFNDTIRLEHDFNHLEKLDGHLGWEWEEAIRRGLRHDPPADACSAAPGRPLIPVPRLRSWLGRQAVQTRPARLRPRGARRAAEKPYGVMYVGSNWQRWEQVRRFLEQIRPGARARSGGRVWSAGIGASGPTGPCRRGSWGSTPTRPCSPNSASRFATASASTRWSACSDKARFAPVFHRPLFRHLGLVTNRTFETFYADTLPVLMLPRDLVAAVYGAAALALVPGDDVAAHLTDALRRPEPYWDAVLQTRSHLARHHSYAQRFQELEALVTDRTRSGAAR